MSQSNRTLVKRSPKRGIYEQEDINEILDHSYLCHVAIMHHGQPVSIPTLYGREGNSIYFHGATVSRLMLEMEKGFDVCVSIARVTGLVLARSAFHHSMNYESVVIFGKASLVDDKEKMRALKAISDHLIPGRWEEVREPNEKELKGTKVIQIHLDECSAKRRTGGPIDDEADYLLDVWAGVLPIHNAFSDPVPDARLKDGLELSQSIVNKMNQA